MRVCLAMLTLLVATASSGPARGSSPEVSKRYDFLLKGMDDQRQRLRTGVYRANGRLFSASDQYGPMDGAVRIFSAFDYDTNQFRFDRLEPVRRGKVNDPTAPANAMTPDTRGGRMIRLPDRTISHVTGSVQVNVGKFSNYSASAIKPIDVRSFGTFYRADLVNERSTTYEQLLKYYERDRPESVEEERPGIWRITWMFPIFKGAATIRRDLWLDQNSGFSPIRMELRHRPKSMPEGTWPEPMEQSDTTWVEISGVWVPKTSRIVAKLNGQEEQIYEFSLDWDVVNGPVPPRLFAIEGFELPRNYVVVDNSLGRDVMTGLIGADHKLVKSEVATPPPLSPRRTWRGWGPSLPSIAATLGILALIGAGWLVWRSSAMRRGAGN